MEQSISTVEIDKHPPVVQSELNADSGSSYDGTEVLDHLFDNLPPLQVIHSDSSVSKAQFPFPLVYDVAELYGFGMRPDLFACAVALNETESKSRRIMITGLLALFSEM